MLHQEHVLLTAKDLVNSDKNSLRLQGAAPLPLFTEMPRAKVFSGTCLDSIGAGAHFGYGVLSGERYCKPCALAKGLL